MVKAAVSFSPGATTGPALYFSRNLIPSGPGDHYHHIGIYAFRRAALRRFVTLKPRILELREDGSIADFRGSYDEYLSSQGIAV